MVMKDDDVSSSSPSWYPQRGTFHHTSQNRPVEATDSSPVRRSKSVLVTDIPPQVRSDSRHSLHVKTKHTGDKSNYFSRTLGGDTGNTRVSHERISQTRSAPPNRSTHNDVIRTTTSQTTHSKVHGRGQSTKSKTNRNSQSSWLTKQLQLNLEGIDTNGHSESVSNINRVYNVHSPVTPSLDSPLTPTKYTYNYTASFDSGISDLDLSKPLSPLNRDHSVVKEVPTHTSVTQMSSRRAATNRAEQDPRFLKKVQRELDDQRTRWEHEVDQLSSSVSDVSLPKGEKVSQQGQNSFVDTSSGRAIFKAFVDVSGYPRKGITVSVDSLLNKVVVTAANDSALGTVTRTFTQKVSLPRYADHEMMSSHLSKKGVLKIEVPLLYYFERTEDAKARDRKAKSFVYQVESNGTGGRVLEILVNTGAEFRAKELKILVQDDNKLVVIGQKEVSDEKTGKVRVDQKLIKQYTLPDYTDIDHITSKLGKDGRLQVNVPMLK